jgi:hypothetical protein
MNRDRFDARSHSGERPELFAFVAREAHCVIKLKRPERARVGESALAPGRRALKSKRYYLVRLIAAPSRRASDGADDDSTRGVVPNCQYAIVWQPFRGRERLKTPDGITGHTGILGSSPEVALSVFMKRGESVTYDPGRVALAEDTEVHSIKADESIVGREPEIPIACLENRAHRVLRQTFIGGPKVCAVLISCLLSRGGDDYEEESQ